MAGIQDHGLSLTAEGTHVHTGHGIHLHHILHTSALFGQSDHGRDLLVLQLLYFDSDLVVLQSFLHQLADALRLLFHLFLGLLGSLGLQGIGHIRINTLELDSLVLFLPQKGCSHKFRWQWRSVWTVPLCLFRVLFHIPQTLWHIPAGFPGPIPSTYAPNLCTDTAIAVHSSPVPVLRSATGKLLQKQCRRI